MADIHPDSFSYDPEVVARQLDRVHRLLVDRSRTLADLPVTAAREAVLHALRDLPAHLPARGLATTSHLLDTVAPALAPGQAGPRCFGLVIGGVTPAAQLADLLVTSYDPCVQVNWPEHTVAVALEARTLAYLLALLDLPASTFTHNTLTTGATASNLLGLSLGRDWAVAQVKRAQGHRWSVPEQGLGGVEVDVLVADAHASVRKAAALAGLGRQSVVPMGDTHAERKGRLVVMDLDRLEHRLRENVQRGRGRIVVTSFGEVNTGAINSDTPAVRALCDQYHAWLHIDAAFAAFALFLPEYAPYRPHLALADSITSDAHKWLNVPYDCGVFISRARPVGVLGGGGGSAPLLSPPALPPPASPSPVIVSLYDLCGPGEGTVPAYLASPPKRLSDQDGSNPPELDASRALPSPLFMNVENSRRFRALPLYASLLSLGRDGYARLVSRNVDFTRQIEAFLRAHPAYDVLTPPSAPLTEDAIATDPFAFRVLNIVLFAPSAHAPERYRLASPTHPDSATTFLAALNASREIFCTGTVWRGRSAVRIAVSNWQTELQPGREWAVVRRVLEDVMRE